MAENGNQKMVVVCNGSTPANINATRLVLTERGIGSLGGGSLMILSRKLISSPTLLNLCIQTFLRLLMC